MKANELMVGDLILIHEPDCKGHRIDYISEIDEEVGADGELYPIGYIKPIPLTEDILGKNFKDIAEPHQRIYGGRWAYYDEYIEIEITEYTDGLWQVEVDEIEMGGLPSWRMYVSYIHQLQHALRLCNIDKEIEL